MGRANKVAWFSPKSCVCYLCLLSNPKQKCQKSKHPAAKQWKKEKKRFWQDIWLIFHGKVLYFYLLNNMAYKMIYLLYRRQLWKAQLIKVNQNIRIDKKNTTMLETPFSCSICLKEFAKLQDLGHHVETIHVQLKVS